MKVFLDTNVIIDFFDSNREYHQPAAIVFDLALKGKLDVSVCSQSFVNAFYVLRKTYDKVVLYDKMHQLFKLCKVTPVDALIIERALNREGRDFEDTVQYFSSKTIDASIILSRDKVGFKEYEVECLSPSDFLDKYLYELVDSK